MNMDQDTFSETMKHCRLVDLESASRSSGQHSAILNNPRDSLCRDIWKTVCRKELAGQDLTPDDLGRIAQNRYLDQPLLKSVVLQEMS
jgi:hypothetical protein